MTVPPAKRAPVVFTIFAWVVLIVIFATLSCGTAHAQDRSAQTERLTGYVECFQRFLDIEFWDVTVEWVSKDSTYTLGGRFLAQTRYTVLPDSNIIEAHIWVSIEDWDGMREIDRRYLILHEVLHLFLAPITIIAYYHDPYEATRADERVVRRLARLPVWDNACVLRR